MNHQLKNKIEATNTNINSLLKDQKFYIDYFQREYRWGQKHIQLLIEDLTTTFLKSFNSTDKRSEVANYQSYYLGPVVFSVNTDDGKKLICTPDHKILTDNGWKKICDITDEDVVLSYNDTDENCL